MSKTDYKSSGVDIDAGNEAVNRIGPLVKTTFGPEVLTGLGSFGSMVDLGPALKDYRHPILIQSIDGVGTKVSVARRAGKYFNLGIDVVSATTNDILVHGARPVSFLDYIANEKLDPGIVEEIVAGMVENCRANGIPLVGGETAEMPSTYLPGEHDVVGCVTGLVEKDRIINGASIAPGDAVIGLPSSGLHTNGFSLARKVFFEIAKMTTEDYVEDLGESVGDALLRPHSELPAAHRRVGGGRHRIERAGPYHRGRISRKHPPHSPGRCGGPNQERVLALPAGLRGDRRSRWRRGEGNVPHLQHGIGSDRSRAVRSGGGGAAGDPDHR